MLRVAEQYSGSDTGMQRRANEDSLLARSPLFVVADGMGGAQAGEVASRIAIESFDATLEDNGSPEETLATRALSANTRIYELAQSDPDHAGMGTTLTAVYVGASDVAIAHVGDSRAYCLREGKLLRLTHDHSLVDELIRQGRLTPEEAEDHPQRSIITRALGPEAVVEVDTQSFRARPGDVYLLCSDGLTTMLSEATVAEVLLAHPRLHEAGERLIALANEAGGRDNITVILVRLEEVGGDGATRLTPVAGAGEDPQLTKVSGTRTVEDPQSTRVSGTRTVAPRRPREPTPAAESHGRSRIRRALVPLVALAVLGIVAAGAWVASQSVYFIGTNSRGLVTLYRGVPYELPGGIKLYTSDFVSGVSAASLTPPRRHTLLDHSLRSENDAGSLMRSLELGQLSGG
ncbi:MAG TPA: Stp1/IreP family PP2C-type Ser/Thr phosphatase [Solirubrobacteraceae bacterium]|jgi:protein phosphatase|nr:Stp1/IreP family PP2C-type Ser/Thr phosphatase [Solirubrobacteraceae bacterium]